MIRILGFILLQSLINSVSVSAQEIFQVTYPVPDYTGYVYQQTLVSHTFGDSYGIPATVTYYAPSADFNKVILTLNTSISGGQYDRLAHLYLDGIPLWRTSTPEPGGDSITATMSKDLSDYANLFKRNEITLLFQLDNTLDDSDGLDGSYFIELYAYYYYDKDPQLTISERDSVSSSIGDFASFYENTDPADQLYAIVDSVSPPLLELPSSKLQYTIPKLNSNTTRVKLDIFISGNADEEFWYSNTINNFTDIFTAEGDTLTNYGPCRMVNVFLGGEKISVAAPQPFIFSGGLAPGFWDPIVADNTYDLKPIEIELTALLPLIWAGNQVLEVEISNCLDNGSTVGSNWLTTGNILTWESEDVTSSAGSLVSLNYDGGAGGYGYSRNNSLVQIVNGEFGTSSSSVLNYTLVDGSQLSLLASSASYARVSNVQNYQSNGAYESLISIYTTKQSFSLTDNSLPNQSGSMVLFNTSTTFPLYVNLGNGVSDVVSVVSDKTSLNGNEVIYVGSSQNATIIDNYYSSNTELYKANIIAPFTPISYERYVRVENSNINLDNISGYSPSTTALTIGSPNMELFDDIFSHLNLIVDENLIENDILNSFYQTVESFTSQVQQENVIN